MALTIYPTITLSAPGLDDVVLDPATGHYGQRLDLGFPVVREVVDEAPDADGTDDTTEHIGARTVTLELIAYPETGSLWELEQRLRAFMHPKLRTTMTLQRAADAPLQQITLRASNLSAVIGDALRAATQRDPEAQPIMLQWVAPSGIIEAAEPTVTVGYAGGDAFAGRTYPLTFPRTYPGREPSGVFDVVNAGTADVSPLIRIYGPCTDPVLDNQTQGKSLAFDGLTLTAAEFLEIDIRAKTVLLNGDPADTRFDTLDLAVSSWWTLSPGVNHFRFHPATFTPAVTLAEFTARHGWL